MSRGRVLAFLLAGAVTAVLVVLGVSQQTSGTKGTDGTGGAKGKGTGPFTIAVVTRDAGQDRAGAARVALAELRDLLRDNKAEGRLPLEFVAVAPRDGLTLDRLRRDHPRLVAAIADDADLDIMDQLGAPEPVVGTCRWENPPGLSRSFQWTVAPEITDVGWQVRAYLGKKHRTQQVVVFGAYGSDAIEAEQLGQGAPGPEWEDPKLPPTAVHIKRPGAMSAPELRSALSGGRGDAVYLAGSSFTLRDDLRALARAGFRGPVLYTPWLLNTCVKAEREDPGQVPDGITLYRVGTAGPGAVRAEDCVKGETEFCPYLLRLPDRPGALEEYEAAQTLIRVYRTVWVEGRGTTPSDPEEMASALQGSLNGQIVRGLSGWFEVGGPPGDGHTLGFGHDIWLERWAAGDGGWTVLGPVSAEYG
ncbi:hypothetical protein [Streptomyces ureilyticus]|uniref:ABC transporter substrate-binding protein n=1 Tax=Streptomyces ureilyticus TaxID=1775131 RepID=A0ABX0DYE4_9ACTN|nr:hypothetical protein [Streptomyces ureilyticus]NGO45534.1 hypothetical protein [Streptomyces ureilyticus]